MTQPPQPDQPAHPSSEHPPSESPATDQRGTEPEPQSVVIIGPSGMAVSDGDGEDQDVTDLVGKPAKVMRIGSMIKQLLEEVRTAPLDEAGRARLAEIHERSLQELEQGLAPELVEELRRISLPFNEDSTPSESELRIAQAQLVGWLEGLFHGIQTALMAQQMAAQAQIAQMRRALPGPPNLAAGQGGPEPGEGSGHGTGQYL